MRRADRLFRIVTLMQRRKVVRAFELAELLGVSERTIYRDIRDLGLSGVPIQGEAGVGYALSGDYTLPPLMFTREEIEALVLGARLVQSWSDPDLANAARQVLEKVEAVLPALRKSQPGKVPLFAPRRGWMPEFTVYMPLLREATHSHHKVRMAYTRADGTPSERVVHPLALLCWGNVWTFIGWCELRGEIRHFRMDRIGSLEMLEETYDPDRHARWREELTCWIDATPAPEQPTGPNANGSAQGEPGSAGAAPAGGRHTH